MYTLHFLFVSVLFLLALESRWAFDRNDRRTMSKWLLALGACLGLSFTNHLMTSLLVPGLILIMVWGSDWPVRSRAALAAWKWVLPALLVPLLLYAYLPLRSAAGPLMNWGSPDTLGDFWRHITGWQYRAYLFERWQENLGLTTGYLTGQWAWLTTPVIVMSLVGAVLLARANRALLVATGLTAAITELFALAYGISEIEPYLVPLYMMLLAWLALIPSSLGVSEIGATGQTRQATRQPDYGPAVGASAVLLLLALVSAVVDYPRSNLSGNHLAEQFALNAFASLPANSLVITDYWDFYAPTLYLQNVRSVRPDVTVVDMSLLRYPWYSGYLSKKYPWLTAASSDILGPFSVEQRKWVNGQPFDANLLQQSYFALLNSFVDRNYDRHPPYVLFLPCQAGTTCDSSLVGQGSQRQPAGLVQRLWKQTSGSLALPPVPTYSLAGITSGKVPMDGFARANTQMYVGAYSALAQMYEAAGRSDDARKMADEAGQINAVLAGE